MCKKFALQDFATTSHITKVQTLACMKNMSCMSKLIGEQVHHISNQYSMKSLTTRFCCDRLENRSAGMACMRNKSHTSTSFGDQAHKYSK